MSLNIIKNFYNNLYYYFYYSYIKKDYFKLIKYVDSYFLLKKIVKKLGINYVFKIENTKHFLLNTNYTFFHLFVNKKKGLKLIKYLFSLNPSQDIIYYQDKFKNFFWSKCENKSIFEYLINEHPKINIHLNSYIIVHSNYIPNKKTTKIINFLFKNNYKFSEEEINALFKIIILNFFSFYINSEDKVKKNELFYNIFNKYRYKFKLTNNIINSNIIYNLFITKNNKLKEEFFYNIKTKKIFIYFLNQVIHNKYEYLLIEVIKKLKKSECYIELKKEIYLKLVFLLNRAIKKQKYEQIKIISNLIKYIK